MGAFTGFYLILVVVFNGGVFTYLDKKRAVEYSYQKIAKKYAKMPLFNLTK